MQPHSRLIDVALVLLAIAVMVPSASADQTPDDFWLDMVADAHRGAFVYSNRVVVTGIDEPTPVAIVRTDAQDAGYSIGCTATYTNQPGFILNGQSLCVRHRSGYKRSETDLSVGTWTFGARFVTYALPDHDPAPAGFPIAYNAPLGDFVVAGPVTVRDIGDGLAPPQVDVTGGLEFQIGCAGEWQRYFARIDDLQTICVQVWTAGTPDTLTYGVLQVGDATWPFAAFTGAALTGVPQPFSFAPRIGVRRGFESRGKAYLRGLNYNYAAVTVTGGYWGFEDAPFWITTFTDVPGFAYDGALWLSHTAPARFGATTTTAVNVGGVAGQFTSRTIERKVLTSGRLHDFNGDGHADMLWRNAITGDVRLWLLDDYYYPQHANRIQHQFELLRGRPDWTPTHVGDLDGDGTSDIVWRNESTGETALWLLSEGIYLRGAVVVADPAWRVTHVGDFDGDGTTDLVWHNAIDGRTLLWLSQGAAFHAWSVLLQHPDWKVQHTGDFDGDGKSDLLWRNRATGETAMWLLDGTAMRSGAIVQANGAWTVEVVGDLDGDGRDDLVWSGPNQEAAVYWMDGTSRRAGARLPAGTGVPVAVADFEADGVADLLIRSAQGFVRYQWNGLFFGIGGIPGPLDLSKTLLRVFDYDGDGCADLAYEDPAATPPGTYLWYEPDLASFPPQPVSSDPAWKLQ